MSSSGHLGRIKALIAICVAALAVLLFPPLDVLENANLVSRMVGDLLMVLYSILLGYALDRYVVRTRGEGGPPGRLGAAFRALVGVNRRTKGVILGVVVPLFAFAYWNLPATFDATAADIYTRYLGYLTFVVVAGLAGMAVSYMPKLIRVGAMLLAFLSVGSMGSMMLVWQPGFYTFYSSSQNVDANTFLMMIGAAGELVGGGWALKALDIV